MLRPQANDKGECTVSVVIIVPVKCDDHDVYISEVRHLTDDLDGPYDVAALHCVECNATYRPNYDEVDPEDDQRPRATSPHDTDVYDY